MDFACVRCEFRRDETWRLPTLLLYVFHPLLLVFGNFLLLELLSLFSSCPQVTSSVHTPVVPEQNCYNKHLAVLNNSSWFTGMWLSIPFTSFS